MFKKLLTGLGAFVLLLLLASALAGGSVYVTGKSLNASASAYVKDAITTIASGWNPDELFRRTTPQMQASLSKDDANKLFAMLRTLGRLKSLSRCEGQAAAHYAFANDAFNTELVFDAQYACAAVFEHAPATLRLALLKTDMGWQINGLNVDSDFFAQQPPAQPQPSAYQ